jgi:hypothetical protein
MLISSVYHRVAYHQHKRGGTCKSSECHRHLQHRMLCVAQRQPCTCGTRVRTLKLTMPGSIVVSLNDYSESSSRYSDGMRPVRVMSLHKTCQYSTHGDISFLVALIVVDLPGPVRRCGVGDLAPCGGGPDISDADLGCVPFPKRSEL